MRQECNETRRLQRVHGPQRAALIRRRLEQLAAVECLEHARTLPGRLHELKGDRAGELALRLDGGWRLIFEPAEDPPPTKPDGGLDWSAVTAVRILEVVDYHE